MLFPLPQPVLLKRIIFRGCFGNRLDVERNTFGIINCSFILALNYIWIFTRKLHLQTPKNLHDFLSYTISISQVIHTHCIFVVKSKSLDKILNLNEFHNLYTPASLYINRYLHTERYYIFLNENTARSLIQFPPNHSALPFLANPPNKQLGPLIN